MRSTMTKHKRLILNSTIKIRFRLISTSASQVEVTLRSYPILTTSIIWILGSLMSSNVVIKCNCSIWIFLMMVWSLFIIDLMGLFFYNKIGSIISIGDLPTTNIIEPFFCFHKKFLSVQFKIYIIQGIESVID